MKAAENKKNSRKIQEKKRVFRITPIANICVYYIIYIATRATSKSSPRERSAGLEAFEQGLYE